MDMRIGHCKLRMLLGMLRLVDSGHCRFYLNGEEIATRSLPFRNGLTKSLSFADLRSLRWFAHVL